MREVSRTGWRARRGYCEYFLLHGKSGESQSIRAGQHLSGGWPAECLPDEGIACFWTCSFSPSFYCPVREAWLIRGAGVRCCVVQLLLSEETGMAAQGIRQRKLGWMCCMENRAVAFCVHEAWQIDPYLPSLEGQGWQVCRATAPNPTVCPEEL